MFGRVEGQYITIESRSPGPLAKTLLIRSMALFDIAIIEYRTDATILFLYINLWDNKLKMFTKHLFELKMFGAISWSYRKWFLPIVHSIVPLYFTPAI